MAIRLVLTKFQNTNFKLTFKSWNKSLAAQSHTHTFIRKYVSVSNIISTKNQMRKLKFFFLFLVHCYFCFTGVNTAISELKAGRNASSKLTILLTNADWGNLGKRYTGFILGEAKWLSTTQWHKYFRYFYEIGHDLCN